ncbi:hypothetical protein M514_03045 [Trichuris suis]|uniref:SANT domain-containing protein n=1 Tax=Trichuris suis TaxID=68888 RepID=A0A085NFS4_9BILA|nr:hypothetical protein M513_03045 [Trichuris suis]KFD68320.1 hypothetical protein M514_03045 [Trichuris suis]KHJ43085.1 Myb-like DNA-binding domain protein [Trichuris suis]
METAPTPGKSGYSLKCPQKGTSRLGCNYQAVIPPYVPNQGKTDSLEKCPTEVFIVEPQGKKHIGDGDDIRAGWTDEEKSTFNKLIEKHHKCFREFLPMLPNKSLGDIIAYFYLWKRTEGADHVRWRSARYVTPEESEKKVPPKECRNCGRICYQPTNTMVGVLCRTCSLSYSLTGCLPSPSIKKSSS